MRQKLVHPGRIQFVDGNTNRVTREVDADRLPDAVRFAMTDDGWVAITKIVETVGKTHITWRAFSDDGRVLRVGMSRK